MSEGNPMVSKEGLRGMPVRQDDFQRFSSVYFEVVREAYAFWTPEMQAEIAVHCHGWAPGLFDFKGYLDASVRRFYRAYRVLSEMAGSPRVCDVGGFWGVFPVTLKRLGFDVTMTESLKYYSHSFDPLFGWVRAQGVVIEDHDPFEVGAEAEGVYDLVMAMAVLEHYPHSPKTFMENLKGRMALGGRLYLEVPNIAYWPKRWALLWGRSPLAPLGGIYLSEVPFIGHHHEYTKSELMELAGLAQLRVVAFEAFNYGPDRGIHWRTCFSDLLRLLAYRFFPETRECLMALCARPGDE